jgi:hypothetical protein
MTTLDFDIFFSKHCLIVDEHAPFHAFILYVITEIYYRWHPLVLVQQAALNGTETTLPTLAFLSRHSCHFSFTCVFSHGPETMTTLGFCYIYQIIIAVVKVALDGAEATMTTLAFVVFILTASSVKKWRLMELRRQ